MMYAPSEFKKYIALENATIADVISGSSGWRVLSLSGKSYFMNTLYTIIDKEARINAST